jgi:hypothetical protein
MARMSFETHLDDPLLREAYAYWRLKRDGRRMPARRQIDPAEVRPLLPHLLISEVVDPERRFRYRLVGTAIARALGRDPTGRCVEEVTSGSYRDYITGLHCAVCRERAPVFAQSALQCGAGVGHRLARRLLLPLSEDDSTVNQILSLVVFQFAPRLAPMTVLDAALAAG